MTTIIPHLSSIQGTPPLKLEGDKSLSHRVLILKTMATGKSTIRNLSSCNDVKATMDCLHSTQPLDCRDSATTLRLLMGLAATQSGPTFFRGNPSLHKRPMERLATPLRHMGAEVTLLTDNSTIASVKGGKLKPIHYKLPVASAQVKSALLLAATFIHGKTVLTGKINSRDHTERFFKWLGADIDCTEQSITLGGPFKVPPFDITLPNDISSAAFWVGAAILLSHSHIQINDVLLNPTRTHFIDVFCRMGARIQTNVLSNSPEARGSLSAQSSLLHATSVSSHEIPFLIDELPLLMVIATQASGTTLIEGAHELHYKESDRIRAMINNLTRMGATIRHEGETIIIHGPTPLQATAIESFGDHRVAMACIMGALIADNTSTIDDISCIAKSYPHFWDDLCQSVS